MSELCSTYATKKTTEAGGNAATMSYIADDGESFSDDRVHRRRRSERSDGLVSSCYKDERRKRRKRDSSRNRVRHHSKRRRPHRSDDSSTSSSSTNSSSGSDARWRRRKRRKHRKRKRKEEKRRMKKDKTRKRTKSSSREGNVGEASTISAHDRDNETMPRPPEQINVSASEPSSSQDASQSTLQQRDQRKTAMMPMSREQYEAQQAQIREVYDEETGRYRLVRGTGEIVERIVSRQDHERINQLATHGDGSSFARHVFSAVTKHK